MKTPTKETGRAWAIKTDGYGGRHRFIGVFWWFEDEPPKTRPCQQGMPIALWRTRLAARSALTKVKKLRPEAKVVRVKYTIKEETP